jgi:hypothetical protein
VSRLPRRGDPGLARAAVVVNQTAGDGGVIRDSGSGIRRTAPAFAEASARSAELREGGNSEQRTAPPVASRRRKQRRLNRHHERQRKARGRIDPLIA